MIKKMKKNLWLAITVLLSVCIFSASAVYANSTRTSVQEHYEYMEFGNFQQTYLTGHEVAPTPEQEEQIKKDIAAAEAAGKEVYKLVLNDIQTRWYTKDPVKWRILAKNSDGRTILLADKTLAFRPMHSTPINSFSASDLSAWLNDVFLPTTFTADDISSLDIDATILNFALASNTTLFPSDEYRKSESTDYATISPIASGGFKEGFTWLSDDFRDPTYHYTISDVGSWSALNDTFATGVRPVILVDLNDQILSGTGTYDDPFTLGAPLNAVTVPTLEDIYAAYGTALKNLPLPTHVDVIMSDGSTKSVAVTWDTSTYDPTTGTYTLTGTLNMDGTDTNTSNLSVSINIIVGEGIPPTEEIPPTDGDLPSTGDNSNITIMLVLGAASVLGIIVLIILLLKRKKKDSDKE